MGSTASLARLINATSYNPAFITSAFNPSGTVAGADAALVSGIAAGKTYLNIHTTNFPGGEIRGFLTPVSGEAVTGAQQGAFQFMTEFLTLMMDPFVYGRTGFGGVGGPELASGPYGGPGPLAPFGQRWTVWGGGYGAASRTTGDPIGIGSHDLSVSTGGGAAGLDYQLSPYTVVGFALGGGGTN